MQPAVPDLLPGQFGGRACYDEIIVAVAAGIALGVDRLVMLFAGADNIDQVVAFTPEGL